MDIGFWATDGGQPLFDENGFFNIPCTTEGDKTGQNLLFHAGEAALIPCEVNLIDDLVRVSERGINLSNTLPLENSSGFPSVPTNGLSVERHVDGECLENDLGSAVGLSILCSNRFSKTESDYVGIVEVEIMQDENNSQPFVEHNLCIPMVDQTCSTGSEDATSVDQASDKKHENVKSTGSPSHAPVDANNVQSNNKRRPKGILWGGYEEVMASLSSPFSSYSLLYEKPQFRKPPKPKRKEVHGSNANPIMKRSASKEPLDSFPTNVKSLMGTGIFNEVLVRYVTPSQELPGILSAAGYICGCQLCNFAKAINAYEFECHAGCKTSHPNNHIHFENGKSMHQIVMELKATPRSKLFDAIQMVTGSPINQKALSAWRELYQADFRSKQCREMGNGGMIQI